MNKFNEYREMHFEFIFDKFEIIDNADFLIVKYYFEIPGLESFTPTLSIKQSDIKNDNLDKNLLNYLIFHIGMVELISYWKVACPKKVIIKAGYLDINQIDWFKKLYFNGLGEYFFLNGIDTNIDTFMDIECTVLNKGSFSSVFSGTGNLIPIGGGKDSVVTLNLLKNMYEENDVICINPKEAHIACIEAGNYNSRSILINRTIDTRLIELNKKGYLNGHTPFSAMVAFVTYLVAYLNNKKYIVLSNEASANEANVVGTDINHQYSKSYEFENDFNNYTKTYFNIDIKYFSLLRPILEFQIGMLFSKYKEFHHVFNSCNQGSKKENWNWCCSCPKCLFVYIILSPFLYKEELVRIFGEDLFERDDLLDCFLELAGKSSVKPFECVGTYEEVNYAISLMIEKLDELPYLLEYYKSNFEINTSLDLEHYYNCEHNLDLQFEKIIKEALNV